MSACWISRFSAWSSRSFSMKSRGGSFPGSPTPDWRLKCRLLCVSCTAISAGSHCSIWTARLSAMRTRIVMSFSRWRARIPSSSLATALILALYVEPEWLKAFRPGWVASGAPGFFGHPHGELSPRIRKLTMDLASDMMARPECRAEHEALLSELMIAVIERFTPWKSFPRSIRELNASACDRRIRRAADYIRVNAGGEADIDTLAKEAGLSRAHFFRLFQSSIGLPPKVYLNVVRMEQAMDSVLHREVPVGEVGTRLGFSDPAHFTRFFRNNAGVSPSEFRQVSRLAG